MATRLALAVVLVSTATVAATSLIALDAGRRASERLVEDHLDSVRAGATFAVASYVNGARRDLTGLARSPMTIDALERFDDAFGEVVPPTEAESAAERAALLDHYTERVIPELTAANGAPVAPRQLLPDTATGVHLQYLFVPEDPTDDPRDIDVADEAGSWGDVHAELHPVFRSAAGRLGADDLLLVDADGDVVYSVAKAAEFATNLVDGEHSSRTLGTTFRAMRSPRSGPPTDAVTTDLSTYPPALGRPVWFQVAPVVVDGRFLGAVAVRRDAAPLTDLLVGATPNTGGFRETGETYLAGTDTRMRSDPRRFVSAPAAYLREAVDAGTLTDDAARLATARSTSVLLQHADGDVVAAGVEGATGPTERLDHLGRDAAMSAAPLGDIGGPAWVVVTQVTTAETSAPLDDARRLLVSVAAALTALLTFGAVIWADRLVRPVRRISERLHAREGIAVTGDLGDAPIASTCEEFDRLVDGFAAMDAQLAARRSEVEAAHQEWLDALSALLPPALVSQVDAGDRASLQRIDSVSVVVVVIREISGADSGDLERLRARMDPLLEAMERLAATHDVTRVKLVGDSWFGAVGHQQPVLDHARRAAAFARDLLDAAPTLTGDRAVELAVGVASGPVSLGLGGSSRLVYDIWGPTVAEAYALARQARTGAVLCSDETTRRLPDGMATTGPGQGS